MDAAEATPLLQKGAVDGKRTTGVDRLLRATAAEPESSEQSSKFPNRHPHYPHGRQLKPSHSVRLVTYHPYGATLQSDFDVAHLDDLKSHKHQHTVLPKAGKARSTEPSPLGPSPNGTPPLAKQSAIPPVPATTTSINNANYQTAPDDFVHIEIPAARTASRSKSNESEESLNRRIRLAINLSLVVNAVLFVAKVIAAAYSGSLAVTASAVDSALDLLMQVIISFADRERTRADPSKYPVGKARLEPVGIILVASCMGMAALQIIYNSCNDIYRGVQFGEFPDLDMTLWVMVLLLVVVLVKTLLWLYCVAKSEGSGSVAALAVDHRNDVLSNSIAIATALMAHFSNGRFWWSDPSGAILMSVYIAFNWGVIGSEQVQMLVGKIAEPEFIKQITSLATQFHSHMSLDTVRAYHFGTRYLVELNVVVPADMRVQEAHDITIILQQMVEQLEPVERAFVHVDYMCREEDEHNTLPPESFQSFLHGTHTLAVEHHSGGVESRSPPNTSALRTLSASPASSEFLTAPSTAAAAGSDSSGYGSMSCSSLSSAFFPSSPKPLPTTSSLHAHSAFGSIVSSAPSSTFSEQTSPTAQVLPIQLNGTTSASSAESAADTSADASNRSAKEQLQPSKKRGKQQKRK